MDIGFEEGPRKEEGYKYKNSLERPEWMRVRRWPTLVPAKCGGYGVPVRKMCCRLLESYKGMEV